MNRTGAHERVARRYLVSGRVQGVGFRWFVREQARALGVAGVVRNQADGSVLVHALGSPGQLTRLEEALRHGPPGAQVDAVHIAPAGEDSQLTPGRAPFPFTIVRGE